MAYVLQKEFLHAPEPFRPVFMVALHTYAHGAGAPNGATLSGYNIYPAAPQLTEAQRQGSLATVRVCSVTSLLVHSSTEVTRSPHLKKRNPKK